MGVKGAKEVLTNLRQLEAKKRQARRQALVRIGTKIKADAISLTPVDTGNLRQSAYKFTEKDKFVQIGYTAEYAPWVHEMTTQALKGEPRADFGVTREGVGFGGGSGEGFYWDSGEPKFLDKAAKQNAKFIMDELAKAMKV